MKLCDLTTLSDEKINKMVCKVLGIPLKKEICSVKTSYGYKQVLGDDIYPDFCNNPADAWPIIDENNITIINDNPSLRYAVNDVASYYNGLNLCIWSANENGLRAAMIVFLKMKGVSND